DALATLGPLLQTNTPNAETLELASTAYEQAKDTSQAVTTLRQAILLEPQNVNLYLDFANISYTHGSFQVGIDLINDGINLQPKAAPLYFARGVLYVQLADYEKAKPDFAEAQAPAPGHSVSAAAQGLTAGRQSYLAGAPDGVRQKLIHAPDVPI